MIAFGTAVADRERYEAIALPSIERVAEPDSLILTRFDCDSIQRAYNELMEESASHSDLEGLVLLHEDLELADEELPRRVRRVFTDPSVGLLGALGGRLPRLHTWLDPSEYFGFLVGPEGMDGDHHLSFGPHEVDAVDGVLLIVAPWVARGIHFSMVLAERFHGYDIDLSAAVRAHGGRVICEDIPCFHHMTLKTDFHVQGDVGTELARMWDPALRPREWAASFQG